jgi:transposase
VDLTGVRVIAIDEFALRRGYQYATIVLDRLTKRALFSWSGMGRGCEELRPWTEPAAPPSRCN